MKKAAIAAAAAVMLAACGQGEPSQPRAALLPGERNEALTAAAERTAVPLEVLMIAAWHKTRFELSEREALMPADEPQPQADDALADDVAAPIDEPAAPVDPQDDAELPQPLEQEESLGIEPDEAPRFGLFATATAEVALSHEATTVAAQLAAAARAKGIAPSDVSLSAWGPVIVEVFNPEADAAVSAEVMRELENAWLDGFDVTTADGERVALTGAGRDVAVVEQTLRAGQYPPITVIPASSRNFGSRAGAQVRFIVIHDIEGTQAGAIAVFRNPARQASAHYVLRASDGRVVKMVNESASAWHAGHSWFNHRSIGIEHEGFADRVNGGGFYNERQYTVSANLVCAIAKKYRIPVDRKHIFGHGNVPSNLSSTTLCSDASANAARCGGVSHHHDPGRFWAWTSYMAKVRRCVTAAR